MMRFGEAGSFLLSFDWVEDCPSLADDGDRASWGLLRLEIRGAVVTRHREDSGLHEDLLLPAAPIALWIARSWPRLVGEERPPAPGVEGENAHEALARLDDQGWDEHEELIEDWLEAHALSRVGDGLLLPDLLFWRKGERFVLSWEASTPWGEDGPDFLSSGWASLPVPGVIEALRGFVVAVARRLQERAALESAVRAELLGALESLEGPSRGRMELVAARLGRSPASLRRWLGVDAVHPERVRERLVSAYLLPPSGLDQPEFLDSPIAMAARSAGPRWSDADHEALIGLGRELRRLDPATKLQAFARRLAERHAAPLPAPHEEGQHLAVAARVLLENPAGRLEIEPLLRELGCALRELALDDAETDAVSLWDEGGRALVAVNRSSPRSRTPWGRRAVLAHELFHLLHGAPNRRFFGEVLGGFPLVSEKAANAFAAELLLPRAALPGRDELPEVLEEAEGLVSGLCEQYGVGWELACWQLHNRAGMTRSLMDALLSTPRRPPSPRPAG